MTCMFSSPLSVAVFLPLFFLMHNVFSSNTADQLALDTFNLRANEAMMPFISISEGLFWVCCLARFLDEVEEIIDSTSIRTWWRVIWNQIDLLTVILIATAGCFRLACYPTMKPNVSHELLGWVDDRETCVALQRWARTLYAMVTVLIWVRMVQVRALCWRHFPCRHLRPIFPTSTIR